MRIVKALLAALLLLAVASGCGGRDVDVQIHIEGGGQETAAPTEAVAPVTEVAHEPAAPTDAPAQSTEAPAAAQPAAPTEAPAQPTATTEVAAPPPTEAPAQPAATAELPTAVPPPPTEAPQAPGDEFTFDPETWQASMTTLSSFRQRVVLDFTADIAGATSRAVYEGEVTTSPTALHSTLRVEGQATSQLPSNQVEVIWIGDQAWVKIGRRPWVPVPASALESEYAGQVVGIGELLPFIQQARRVLPDETVNGIACKHYVYDVSNLQTEAGMTSAQGDIWVAKDGGYVVRLTLDGQGSYYGTYSSSGTLNLVYDLYDVNAAITISPPR